ncbi:MAG: DMT family transporter, partial [Eubacteriales bacterium]|nr:DMT family transporter [Eubacteriales bacterium]
TNRKTLLHGMILGAVFAVTMAFELHGLETTSSSATSFLENTSIILVPLLLIPLKKKIPGKGTLFCCVLALTGVGFLTLGEGKLGFTVGELYCMGAAVSYAFVIILTGEFSKTDDGMQLGILQNGFIGLFSLLFMFLFEDPKMPNTGSGWTCIFALTILCSILGFTLQPIAQAHVDTETAGLFCGLNPLIASTLGVLFLHERLGANGLLGAGFILGSILLSSLSGKKKERRENIKSRVPSFRKDARVLPAKAARHLFR